MAEIVVKLVKFQFHYGAIKGGAAFGQMRSGVGFQFHYGAIKGAPCSQGPSTQNPFQFHYGAIKGFYNQVKAGEFPNFNSTMVRLKVRVPATGA